MTPVANDLLNRAKQEYVEMPGLVLTIRQASRLWNLDAEVCHRLLSTLLREEIGPPGAARPQFLQLYTERRSALRDRRP